MTTSANTHLVIADDHPLFRDALRQAVASVVASAVVSEAGSFDDLTALLEQDSDVDLILLDLTMPGISGFSGLIYLRAQYPAIPVVIVSASDDAGTIRRSLDFGASGFIPKRFGVETLRDAIMKVMEGDVWVPPDTDLTSADDPDMTRLRDRLVTLTPQQVRVLMMLSEGSAQQADRLRARRVGSDHQGACLGDPAEARRREPDAGRDRRREDRRRPVAPGHADGVIPAVIRGAMRTRNPSARVRGIPDCVKRSPNDDPPTPPPPSAAPATGRARRAARPASPAC